MNLNFIALVMGIVEGLTEFVPVSSTGHLIIAGNLLGFTGKAADCFEVVIQLGAILAVVVLYYQRFGGLFVASPTDGEPKFRGLREWILLGLTTAPALVAGVLVHKPMKEYLFKPAPVVAALAVGAILIIVVEKLKPQAKTDNLDKLTYGQALFIGLFQCISLWPGMSRAAATIMGGMICRLERRVAAEYSFLAAVPVMFAATAYDLYKTRNDLCRADLVHFAIGFIVSYFVAMAAVKTFIKLLQRWTLIPFAVYRLVLAAVFAALVFTRTIHLN